MRWSQAETRLDGRSKADGTLQAPSARVHAPNTPGGRVPPQAPSRRVRWLALAGLVALAPKCLVCLLGYAGLGAALGLAGPELCGAPESPGHPWLLGLGAVTLAVLSLGALAFVKYRRTATASTASSSLG